MGVSPGKKERQGLAGPRKIPFRAERSDAAAAVKEDFRLATQLPLMTLSAVW
jgi:hypothetical protein